MPRAIDRGRESRSQRENHDIGNTAPNERRSFSSPLPETAGSLVANSRPRTIRSQLIKREDGRYNEPYSAIVDCNDPFTVLCVQHKHEQVLVRHMPEQEWQRIMREGEEVSPGIQGKTSVHIVAPSDLSTLPVSAAAPSRSPDQSTSTDEEALEPPVFDYFVAPENRIKRACKKRQTFLSHLQLRLHSSGKDVERIVREDRRAMLSVERRNIFLKQYQRDMQHRMEGTPLYTIGRDIPEELVQLFFLSEDYRTATTRGPPRRGAHRTPEEHANSPRRSRGVLLFTIDRSTSSFGERMPFARQPPADGYVVVTVGPRADAFISAWQPRNEMSRFSSGEEEGDPLGPYAYGSAEYLPRDPLDDLHDASEAGNKKSAAMKMPSRMNTPPLSDRSLRQCSSPPRRSQGRIR